MFCKYAANLQRTQVALQINLWRAAFVLIFKTVTGIDVHCRDENSQRLVFVSSNEVGAFNVLESFFHETYVLVFVLNRTALYYFPFDSKFVNVLFQSKMGFSLKKC